MFYVHSFRDVAADKLPFAPEDEEEEEEPEDLCEEDIENAVQRLTERNQQIIQESKGKLSRWLPSYFRQYICLN